MPLCHLYIFFGEIFAYVFHPFFLLCCLFFWILSCVNCLHILEINPLSVASSSNIFSHSEGCLFVLFMVSFAVQNVFSFISFVFISFVCYSHYSRRWVKKRSLCDLSKIFIKDLSTLLQIVFCLCFPLRVSVSGLPFRPLIHFDSIFYMVLENVLISFFYM